MYESKPKCRFNPFVHTYVELLMAEMLRFRLILILNSNRYVYDDPCCNISNMKDNQNRRIMSSIVFFVDFQILLLMTQGKVVEIIGAVSDGVVQVSKGGINKFVQMKFHA